MSSCIATPLRGPVSMRVPFDPASAASVRHALERWLDHQCVEERVREDARLIVSELVGNAVRHAAPMSHGTVLVRWHLEGRRLVLSVCDGGAETIPSRVAAGPDSLGGRGLAIVEALSTAWWVERTTQMHAVHVRLDLHPDQV